MTLKQAINSGKRFRRKEWSVKTCYAYIDNGRMLFEDDSVNNFKKNGTTFELEVDDIMAYDWELEAEKPATELKLFSTIGKLSGTFTKGQFDVDLLFPEPVTGAHFSERDLDKILDFFYNNTKIGKSRIIPF